jgi:zinc protease
MPRTRRPSATLRALGAARINATTSHDLTSYFSIGPAAGLAEMLALEASRLDRPLGGVSPAVFAVESGVVRNELRERNENGGLGQIVSWVEEALFPAGHPYARPVGGTHASLAGLTLARAQSFTDRHYRPDRAMLTVIGDFSDEQLGAAVRSLPAALIGNRAADASSWAPAAQGAPLEPPAPPPASGTPGRTAMVARPELWIGWTLPGSYGPYAGLADVLAGVLGQQSHELQEKDPDIVDVDFGHMPAAQADLLYARVTLLHGRQPEKVGALITETVRALWATRLNQDEGLDLDVARTVLSSSAAAMLEAEPLLTRALNVSGHAHLTGDAGSYSAALDRIQAVTARRLAYYAFSYVKPERARTVLVLPDKQVAPAGSTGVSSPLPPALEARTVVAAAEEDPSALARVVVSPQAARSRRFVLANGLQVLLWRRPEFPVVAAALGFLGGRAGADPRAAELLAEHPAGLELTTFCAGAPEWRGITLSASSSQDVAVDTAIGGAGNFSAILAALAERAVLFRHASWPSLRSLSARGGLCEADRLEAARAGYWQKLHGSVGALARRQVEAISSDPRREPGRQVLAALLAGTPYHRRLDIAQLQALTPASVRGWLERSRVPDNAFLVVVGAVPDDAEALIRGWFASWRSGGLGRVAPVRELPGTVPPAARQIRLPLPGATQVELFAGCTMPASNSRERLVQKLLAAYLSQRLEDRLREQLGLTYGVGADVESLRGGFSLLSLATAVENARAGEALRVYQETWQELAQAPDPRTLAQVRWDLARAFNAGRTAAELMAALVELAALGAPAEDLDRFGEQLAGIRAPDLAAALRACQATAVTALAGEPATLERLHRPTTPEGRPP